MLDENAQQVPLAGGELDRLAAAAKLSPLHIEGAIAEPRLVRPDGSGHRAFQHIPHAQQQFARLERFRQIVVASRRQPFDPVGCIGERRQHEDRQVALHLPERAGEIEAVLAGHHHIEDEDIECKTAHLLARLAGVGRERHPKPIVRQIGSEQFANPAVIVDDQDMGGLIEGGAHPASAPP